ncbi:MAG: DNA oxidative demethylase AlkB [Proteobacteria bacterium]|nr:DNA oxidative demethylase AlkB [Pseudomonadota bacterium]MBU6426084.1 DNA oxidative demethylase AlkB [Rhodospirillales bacterium]
MSLDLFPDTLAPPGLTYLPGFALGEEADLVRAVMALAEAAPFRRMKTPGGKEMSAAMTNCGAAGWVSDAKGYRYARQDPLSGGAWPEMPDLFRDLAMRGAAAGGFTGFVPDMALINRYEPGAKMTLHQDIDERDFSAPIVSVSLGLPAVFLWGGLNRTEKPARLPLTSGDVLVWGGAARKFFHGIAPVKPGVHELTGAARLNLTFRQAL